MKNSNIKLISSVDLPIPVCDNGSMSKEFHISYI